MTYIRLFYKENLSDNLNSNLDKSQSHYISKVMRIKRVKVFLYLMMEENGKQK